MCAERSSEPLSATSGRKASALYRMLGAKLCVDIAENALAYALLIIIVRRTGSSIHSTLFVLALTVPGVIFSIPAGAVADSLPKRPVVIAALAVRIGVMIALIRSGEGVWLIYAVTLAFFAVGQVFSPIWLASMPALIAPARLSQGHALFNLTQLAGQVAGVVLLSPILLKTLGDRAVFIVVVLFLAGAAVITARIGGLPGRASSHRTRAAVDTGRAGLRAGWYSIVADAPLFLAVVQLAIVAAILRCLIVVFPFYTHQVLGIAPEDAVYVAAPAAVGAALGLLVAPVLGMVGRSRLASVGFVFLVGSLGCLALINLLRPLIAGFFHLGMTGFARRVGIPPIVTTAMLFALPMGFGIALNLVAARTVLNQRAPVDAQARVIATQSALATLVSLIPLLLVGALTSLIGARPVMLLVAILAAVAPGWLMRRRASRGARADRIQTLALPVHDEPLGK